MRDMEKVADALGQIIFRLETNLQNYTLNFPSAPAAEAMVADFEKLKEMKALLMGKRGELVVTFPEEERQMMLMALAHLAVERPGWDDALNRLALKLDIAVTGKAKMYEGFKDLRTDTLHLAAQSPVKSST